MPRKPARKKLLFAFDGKNFVPVRPGIKKKRFRTDPAFKGSRRAAGELALASGACKLIRQSIGSMQEVLSQKEIHNRLTGKIMQLLRESRRANGTHPRLNDLPWSTLRNFEFNNKTGFSSHCPALPAIGVNQATGEINITIPDFKPVTIINTLKGVTHCRVLAGAAAINFNKKLTAVDYSATDYLPVKKETAKSISLSLTIPAPAKDPLFIVLGIANYKETRNKMYELFNLRYLPLTICKVEHKPLPRAARIKKPTTRRNTIKKK